MAIKYIDLLDGTTTANSYTIQRQGTYECLSCQFLGLADYVWDSRGHTKALCPDCEYLGAVSN